jgi:predicted PurR-regulated permease PerM
MNGSRPLMVLAGIAVIFLLYWGEAFFVPLFVALLISYALSPVVDSLTLIIRWRVLAAALVVVSVIAAVGLAAYSWSDDVQALWNEVPVATKVISKSLQKFMQRPSKPITEMKKAAADIESIAQTGKPASAGPPPPPAATPPTSLWQVVWVGWKNVMIAASQAMVVVFLVFFMLASGDLFKRKLLTIAAEYNKKRFTLQVIEEIDAQVRRYLVVLLISNVLVGLGTWLVFWWLGVKYPGLWGVVAAILHTAPYFGPTMVAGLSLIVTFVQFEEWSKALIASGSSILVAAMVGSLFTTWLASRQTKMNATASFIGLLFFGWIWGFWGILLGIPLIAIVKTICDHNEDWKPVAELLSQ